MLTRWCFRVGCSALGAIVCVLSGCGDGTSQAELDQATRSVQTSLDTWKRGEDAAALTSAPQPIEFHEDHWDRSAKLVEYELTKTYFDTDGTARCMVGLTVQYEGKDPERVEVIYQIVRKDNRVVIARDPMS